MRRNKNIYWSDKSKEKLKLMQGWEERRKIKKKKNAI